MTQHSFINKNNNEVLYGLDMPTGGYFCTELNFEDELIHEEDGLGLSEIMEKLDVLYEYKPSGLRKMLAIEFSTSKKPTQLQANVYKMFKSSDLYKKLDELEIEIKKELSDE